MRSKADGEFDVRGARVFTIRRQLVGSSLQEASESFEIPDGVRFVSLSLEGRPVGRTSASDPWELLPPLKEPTA